MIKDLDCEKELKILLPETYTLLNYAGFAIHERVTDVVLHDSRGLAVNPRPDSDVDLSLIVEVS